MMYLKELFQSKTVRALFLLTLIVASLMPASLVNAGVWDNRSGLTKGYFSNRSFWSLSCPNNNCSRPYAVPSSVMPESYGGLAIPDSVNSVASLVAFLKTNNQQFADGGGFTAGKWMRAGSAFIAQTMLGRDGDQANANGGRLISDTDWNDLTARLNAASIEWFATVNTCNADYDNIGSCAVTNTLAVFGGDDVDIARESDRKSQTGIRITSKDGSTYRIFRTCANPVGLTNGINPAPKDFNLTPSVTSNGSTRIVAEADSAGIPISYGVLNSGAGPSNSTNWQLARCVFGPGAPASTYATVGDNTSDPVSTYRGPGHGGNCAVRDSGSGAVFSPPGSSSNINIIASENAGSEPLGSHVCYILSVNPPQNTSAANVWRHSTPFCIVIATKPKVQVLGSDASVGKAFLGTTVVVPSAGITTSSSTKSVAGNSYTFGSWVEYGIFATGVVKGAGSASAYAGPAGGSTGLISPAVCDAAILLTFNNASSNAGCDAAQVGAHTTTQPIPDIASSFPLSATTPVLGANDLSKGTTQGVYTANGTLTLTGGVISKGRWIVLNAPNTDVTISGDITYTPAVLNSVMDIPQLVIIARNIYITDTVGRIDAWLVAKPSKTLTDGKINTCSSVAEAAPLTSQVCAKQLTVNGPVMANKLVLRRTTDSGSGANSGNPAEIFNLRPDAYLWAGSHAASTGRIQTVYSTELPPRL